MSTISVQQLKSLRLEPGKSRELSGGNNLVIRAKGTKSSTTIRFVYEHVVAGKKERKSLGTFPALSLQAARAAALQLKMKALRGESILEVVNDDPKTVRELYSHWREQYVMKHCTRSYKSVDALFENHIFPDGFGDMKLATLKPSDIKAVIARATGKDYVRQSANVVQKLNQLFKHAIAFHILTSNPASMYNSQDYDAGVERKRNLDNDELKILLRNLWHTDMRPGFIHEVLLILSLGTRSNETRLIEKSHIDIQSRRLTIPVENQKKTRIKQKSRTAHIVYLSDYSIKQIEALYRLSPNSKYLVPSQRSVSFDDSKPHGKSSLYAQILENQGLLRAKSTVLEMKKGPFTVHDIRRTFASRAQELDILEHIINKCLNHRVSGGVVSATYLQSELFRQCSAAWAKFGEYLEAMEREAFAEYPSDVYYTYDATEVNDFED